MLHHGIDDNILNYHPSYSGLYQDKGKKESSTKR